MATGNAELCRALMTEVLASLRANGMTEEVKKQEEALRLTYRDRHKQHPPADPTRKGLKTMSHEEKRRLLGYLLTHPHMSNRKVGTLFGVDGGRCSEVLELYQNKELTPCYSAVW